ncbi:MAG TPA: SulP family inorganic anion transporter [Candidatus Binatia bacterium]|nr:SulP family inorganic anion transporter [Candidatus Binatia bacterium]
MPPGLRTLLTYRRGDLRHDVTAGLSVAAVAIPVGVAYAQLAGFEPVVGLYASILPLVAYAMFGTSRQLIVGPDAATCAMTAAAVAPLAGGDQQLYVSLTIALTFTAGLFCIGASFLRLGGLADFLSRPILVGYLAGVALTIILGQIGKVTGLTLVAGGITPRLLEVVQKSALVHWPTVAVGAGAFVVLVVAPRLSRRVPAALLALIASGTAVALLGLDQTGVAVVGAVPAGLPTFRMPVFPVDVLGRLMAEAAAVALVSFTSGIVTTRAFASKNQYDIDVDREFAALGAAQLAASVSQGFPVAGADSRTAANDSAGGRTQVSGLVAAGAIALVLVFFTGPLRYAPIAALGAVLIKSAMSLIDVKAFREILRLERVEFLLAVLTTLGVVWFGAIDAVLVAVLLATLRFVHIAARPNVELLGAQPDVRGFHDLQHFPGAQAPPGLVLFRFDGPLTFFNAPYFKERLLAAANAAGPGLRAVVIDATSFSTREDTTAVFMLIELRDLLRARGVEVVLAGKRHLIEQWRQKRGFPSDHIDGTGAVRLFSTLDDAVEAFTVAPDPAVAREPGQG